MALRVLVPSKYVEGTLTQQYINQPAPTERNRRQSIDKSTLTPPAAGTETTTMHLVPAGAAAGAGNKIFSKALASTDGTYPCPELVGHILDPGDSIWAVCTTATKVVLRISGSAVPD